MESKEKIRVSLFLDKNLVETANKIMKECGYRSRNQFYSVLIADAVADEVTDKHKEILGEKFAEAMTEYVEEIKRAVSKGLYRYAVHQEIISRMMAEHYGYSYTDVHDMMWEACKNVRRLRGKVPLEQILAGYYTKNQIETILPTEEVDAQHPAAAEHGRNASGAEENFIQRVDLPEYLQTRGGDASRVSLQPYENSAEASGTAADTLPRSQTHLRHPRADGRRGC